MIVKSRGHVQLRTERVKLGINKKIGHVNEVIGHVNKTIKYEELESINIMTTCDK